MDNIIVKVVEYLKNLWPHFSQLNENLTLIHKNRLKFLIESGCILFVNRVSIPKSLQVNVLELLHLA